ncbi:MAG: MBL fold metallo-hydrolase [Leptospirillia bacterium]
MIIEHLTVGVFQCNCFILGCEKSREAVVVDPGDQPEMILARVAALGLTVTAIVATHAHLDHVGGMVGVHAATQAPTCLHPDDQFLYDNLKMQADLFRLPTPPGGPVTRYLKEGDEVTWGSHRIDTLHTPGHTPGSLCFYMENEDILFSGDTLFQRSVGRTDLWGGDSALMLRGIREKLMPLPAATQVFPGHGPATHIGVERTENPFLRSLS